MLLSLWGKKDDNNHWLPLLAHLTDTKNVIEYLYDNYLSSNQRELIEIDKDLVGYLGFVHDIGKATPAFQNPEELSNPKVTPHNIASEYLLRDTCFNQIVGMHHGYVSTKRDVMLQSRFPTNYGDQKWSDMRAKLFELGQFDLTQDDIERLKRPLSQNSQILLTGLLMMADWIASDTNYFPLIDKSQGYQSLDMSKRFHDGIKKWHLETQWIPKSNFDFNRYFLASFHHRANGLQRRMLNDFKKIAKPGLTIIESTIDQKMLETALGAGEMFSAKNGTNGVFYSLDTQTSTNERLKPIENWLKSINGTQSLTLTHSRARYNHQYQNLMTNTHNVIVNPWYTDKKAILAHFNISTIDQLLMMSLSQRHLALKHLAFSGKTVILDGIPANNPFMFSYLKKTLTWLGNYHVPVIILTNGLSYRVRQSLFSSYLNQSVSLPMSVHYPLITYTDANEIKYQFNFQPEANRHYIVKKVNKNTSEIANLADKYISDGKRVGIILNSVRRSQEVMQFIKSDKLLIHSRFIAKDRAAIETQLSELSNKPMAIISTQVLEQYINLNFDVLITDLAPIDSLAKRLVSLKNNSTIYLTKDSHDHFIYSDNLLKATNDILGKHLDTNDLDAMINNVYDNSTMLVYDKKQVQRAKVFQINNPGVDLRDWMGITIPNNQEIAENTIRNSISSVQVVLLPNHKVENIEDYKIYLPLTLTNYKELESLYNFDVKCPIVKLGSTLNDHFVIYDSTYGLRFKKAK